MVRLVDTVAAGKPEPLLERLDPVLRARVLMALLGLILVGLALVVVIRLGARYVRRLGRSTPARETPSDDDWFAKRPHRSWPDDPVSRSLDED